METYVSDNIENKSTFDALSFIVKFKKLLNHPTLLKEELYKLKRDLYFEDENST